MTNVPIINQENIQPENIPTSIELAPNRESDGTDWFKTGLSLITEGNIDPQTFIEQHENESVPAEQVTNGDIMVYYKDESEGTSEAPIKTINGQSKVDSSKVEVLGFGVVFVTATDSVIVISQDRKGVVFAHDVDNSPAIKNNKWNYYILRSDWKETGYKDPQQPRPFDVLDVWVPKLKQKINA